MAKVTQLTPCDTLDFLVVIHCASMKIGVAAFWRPASIIPLGECPEGILCGKHVQFLARYARHPQWPSSRW